MPMLIVNMGAEMIYVLAQRLKAQNIPRDKSSKVLEDIIKTMHNETFMSETFKPHRMYSNGSTRQIFDRIAHSSIMRLNTNSMDKLYDLMRMGFKYQVLSCSSADELLQQVDQTIELFLTHFGNMKPADFYVLKQLLCRFFQDTRIKVSLFLQNNIQSTDGTLAIHHKGYTASGGKVPGIIRYFDALNRVEEEETFAISSAEGSIEAPNGSVLERNQINTELGFNINKICSSTSLGAKQSESKVHHKTFKATATDGFNLLADLVGTSSSEEKGDNKALRINLFPDDSSYSEDEKRVPTIWIDAASDRKHATDAILREFKLDGDAKHDSKQDDDLLDLMDSTN
ncbi:Uncharacterized conserved protein [Plasmopara halstedii]|uniref:Uncharacterized conserved protein n=1 Tax=Plasmopara halstedii TaxID=4781 RepID=A0A0P1AFK9_PLAHL|nr:Uncharacterized conserved protein [Plasmopara halstedii]CEG39414.1 Uncharacterized conserved protein [Plasmopara halstedii]|eukprot:XP_024575783.1 Uncharacterized conserved protein [Plasmopara halstedii]